MSKQMSLELADAIRMDWGKFTELASSLMVVFGGQVPQGLLPYRKEVIAEALEIVGEQFFRDGNEEAANAMKTSAAYLMFYVDDKVALESAAKNFNNPEFIKAFMPTLGDHQIQQLEYLKKKC